MESNIESSAEITNAKEILFRAVPMLALYQELLQNVKKPKSPENLT